MANERNFVMVEIKKIMVPRYEVTIDMHAINCKNCEEHYFEPDTGAGCQGMNLKEIIKEDLVEECLVMQTITKSFTTKYQAAKWASWCLFNEERWPDMSRVIRDEDYGSEQSEFSKAYARVKEICKENFNITLR